LEIAALNPKGAADLISLGIHAALGDWRTNRAVRIDLARRARVWAKRAIPAILDGETVAIGAVAEIRFMPLAFRALIPAKTDTTQAAGVEVEPAAAPVA
jgi:diacylglycerol kinase family enzyme